MHIHMSVAQRGARPAGERVLAEVAARFQSEIKLVNKRRGAAADARSVLALIAADIAMGDECELSVAGEDEAATMQAMRQFIEHDLPGIDQPLPAKTADSQSVVLPPMLQKAAVKYLVARSLSSGIGQGAVVLAGALRLPEQLRLETSSGPRDRAGDRRTGDGGGLHGDPGQAGGRGLGHRGGGAQGTFGDYARFVIDEGN